MINSKHFYYLYNDSIEENNKVFSYRKTNYYDFTF